MLLTVMMINFSMGKSLREYGIESEQLESVLAEYQLDLNSSIEVIHTTDDVSLMSDFYAKLWGEIHSSDNLEEKQKLTEAYVTGINTRNRSYVLKRMWLPPFKPEYFNEAAKETLRNPDKPNAFAYDYIHALGVAEVDHPDIDLQKYIEGKTVEESLKMPLIFEASGAGNPYISYAWASLSVLARRGDKEALSGVLEAVSAMDDLELRSLTQEVLLNLGYIRQPETIDILIDVLFSDLGTDKNPFPEHISKHWSVSPFAHNAVRPLALAFDDFPIDYWKSNISNLDVEAAREYIRNYRNPPEPIEEFPEVSEVEEVAQAELAIEEPAEVLEVPEEPPEQSSQWWLWLVGGLVVVAGLGLAIRRKS